MNGLKKWISTLTIVSMVIMVAPTDVKAEANMNQEVNHEMIQSVQSSDAIIESVLSEKREDIFALKNGHGVYNLSMENEIIDRANTKLRNNGFDVYEVNPSNRLAIEELLLTDMDDFFRTESNVIQAPQKFTIYVSRNKIEPKAVDFEWQSVYIDANYDPIMSKVDSYDVYKKYSTFPYNNSIQTILNRTYDVITSFVPNYLYSWSILGALGIDSDSIGYQASQAYEINVGVDWTRKYIQIWDARYGMWQTGCSTEYVDWSAWDDLYYYNKDTQRMDRKTSKKQGTVFAKHWNDYTWLLAEAKKGFDFSYIVWDITGDYKHKYNNEVILNFNENF